jgi:hypothetical protein
MFILAMLVIACFAFAPSVVFGGWVGETMCACPGLSKPLGTNATCEDACYGTRSSPGGGNATPGYDNEAAAAAERQRQAEAEHIERERLAEEKLQKDAKFIRDRDAAATTLKGGIGTSVAPNIGGLKGSSRVDIGLKGSTVETGLKELRGSDRVVRDLRGPQAAWKQLHCAAALSGYAFAAIKKTTPDYQESSFLLEQAQKALEGQPLGVECPVTPPFPELHGRAVEMDQVKEAEKKILSRAVVIIERMQRSNKNAAIIAPAREAAETPDEKMRRVQRELNDANRQKISGRTQQEIDQQEKDRKELTNLILANSRLEKGELTSVSVNTDEEEAPRPRRKSVPVPAL